MLTYIERNPRCYRAYSVQKFATPRDFLQWADGVHQEVNGDVPPPWNVHEACSWLEQTHESVITLLGYTDHYEDI